jgi:hypothetical protein
MPADDRLEVSYRGFPVTDPYLVQVRVQNIGPLDVTSDDFDSRRTVAFNNNCQFYGLISSSHPQYTISSALGSTDGTIEMRPMLLKRSDAWEVSAIVSGEPRMECTSPPLINTDVLDKPAFGAKVARSILFSILRAAFEMAPLGAGRIVLAALDTVSTERRSNGR